MSFPRKRESRGKLTILWIPDRAFRASGMTL
jgi:hypothetical protein